MLANGLDPDTGYTYTVTFLDGPDLAGTAISCGFRTPALAAALLPQAFTAERTAEVAPAAQVGGVQVIRPAAVAAVAAPTTGTALAVTGPIGSPAPLAVVGLGLILAGFYVRRVSGVQTSSPPSISSRTAGTGSGSAKSPRSP